MADKKFDYYTDWLGIPAGPRPPDHYTLLGLPLGESDPKKISEAAAARLRLVRQYGLKFPKESTDLLNEIAAAEVCLLDTERKTKYDQSLKNEPAGFATEAPTVLMWYLQRDNQVYGPFPDHQLREMVRSGYVGTDDLVWNEQLAEWSVAKTVASLDFKRVPSDRADERRRESPRPDMATESDGSSVFTSHARRFLPYQLRETNVTPSEKDTLTGANVLDRTEQMYLAWRRTTLFAVGGVSLIAALWGTLVALVEGEMFAPSWFGLVMKLVRALSMFALPAGAVAAGVLWSNLAWSRWILVGGWLIATLTPLVIALVPFQYLTSEPIAEMEFSGAVAGTIQFFRVLAIGASVTPAAIRAGLWLKSLRPASPVGAWSVAIATGLHVLVYWILFIALNQMCGNALLFLVAVCMIAAPLVYLIGYRWLLEPAGPDYHRRILMARGGHLLVFVIGFSFFVVYFITKSFDMHGDLRLFGLSADQALIRPGTALLLVFDFVARTFATSVVTLDLIEQIHRHVIDKKPNGDAIR